MAITLCWYIVFPENLVLLNSNCFCEMCTITATFQYWRMIIFLHTRHINWNINYSISFYIHMWKVSVRIKILFTNFEAFALPLITPILRTSIDVIKIHIITLTGCYTVWIIQIVCQSFPIRILTYCMLLL